MAKLSWEDTEKKAKELGGGTFAALKADKDKVVGVFVGDPDARETHWDGAKSVPFSEEHAKKGATPQLKVRFNFATFKQGNGEDVRELPKPEMKVLEVNAKTFTAINKARKKYGLDKCMFEIERNGAKGDTKTTYSVLPDVELTDAMRAQIAELKPHKLEEAEEEEEFENYGKDGAKDDAAKDGAKSDKPKTDKPKTDTKPKPTADGDAPIAPEDAQALVARLKELPRESLNKFLSKFGVAKIKELKKKDLGDATAFVTELEPKPDPAPADGAEEDPFG
jgi:hypothetical protein